MSETVYLNGSLVPYDQALIPLEDRGMLFADGIYEVVRAYDGHLFQVDAHLSRMVASAAELRLPPPPLEEMRHGIERALSASGLKDSSIYIQYTRGFAGPRSHTLPAQPKPTLFIAARPVPRPDPVHQRDGAAAITVLDRRWHMCHVKSVGLMLNVLAKQAAVESGAQEAIFIRDGVVTEGSATNVLAVFGGVLYTHPEGPHILSGITRQVLLDICRQHSIPFREEPFLAQRLYAAEEVLVCGTNSEILPIRQIDGRAVLAGAVGPVTRRLQELYAARAKA